MKHQIPLSHKSILHFAFCIFLVFCCLFADAMAAEKIGESVNMSASVRIKDIARISSVYNTQLHGYGLVVGLNGTGDSAGARFTVQSVVNMLQQFGITIPDSRLSVKNIAAVMVTAEIPFFAKPGGRIDVLVSSIGDATGIFGGTLLATPLSAPDRQPYVLAQGPVLVGGFSASGKVS